VRPAGAETAVSRSVPAAKRIGGRRDHNTRNPLAARATWYLAAKCHPGAGELSATATRPVPAGRVDPRVDPFTPAGAAMRERQIRTAVKLRRQGHTFEEIGRALFPAPPPMPTFDGRRWRDHNGHYCPEPPDWWRPGTRAEWARTLIRAHEPKLLKDTKQWRLARRARLLAELERDDVGHGVWVTRIRGVLEAEHAGDLNVLIGSLFDQAAAAVAWALWLQDHRE
jgi:hypothetical protein